MEANEFLKLLSKPQAVDKWPVEELKELSLRFPYSQPVQLLYTCSLNQSSDYLFSSQLGKTSILTDDRSLLFDLFEREPEGMESAAALAPSPAVEKPTPKEPIIKEEPIVEKQIEKEPEPVEELVIAEPPFEAPAPKVVKVEPPKKVVEKPKKLDLSGLSPQEKVQAILAENKRIREELATKKTEPKPEPEPQESIAEEEVTVPVNEAESEMAVVEETQVEPLPPVDVQEVAQVETSEETVEEPIETPVIAEDENIVTVDEPVFVIEEEPVPVFEIEEEQTAKPEEVDYTKDSHSFSEWLTVLKNKNHPEEKEKSEEKESLPPVKKIELLDSFVEKLPEIKQKSRHATRGEMPAINWDLVNQEQEDSLVTETLAKVYLLQKHYTKAIKAFEILKLKYPEKSSFFADQISEIRKLINSK